MKDEYTDVAEYQRDKLAKFAADWPEHAEVLNIVLAPLRQTLEEMTEVMKMMAERITTTRPS